MRQFSISLRLAIWYACVSFCGIAVFGLVMWLVLGRSVLSWKDRTLEMRATRARAAIDAGSAEPIEVRLDRLVGILPEGELIQIFDEEGHRVFPRFINPSPSFPPQTCVQPGIRNVTVRREYFRVLCRPIDYGGRRALLVVPSSLIEDQILSRTLTWSLFEMALLLLIVSSIGGYFLSRRALRPVDLLTREAIQITARDLSRRLSVPAADDEIGRLAVEWNNLLSRIEVAMNRIEQFTADASHELRSPLAFIRATAQESLLHGRLNEEARGAFEAICEETADTAQLLDQLLTLARADGQPPPPLLDIVSLQQLMGDVCERMKALSLVKAQTLTLPSFESGSPRLRVSEAHFRRLLTVLVDNAVKYTPQGGRITLSYEIDTALHIRIADNGIGIAPEHLERVFDRFYRVDEARTQASGVGLGLSIARWLAKIHSGEVAISSRLNHGTTITVSLPRAAIL